MSDKILRGVMFDKSVRFTAISAKEMVEAARNTHNLSRVCTAALGPRADNDQHDGHGP